MNKKLLAIAVVAALTPAVASADTTVYGRVHTSIDSISGVAGNSDNLSVNSNSSRFGVKGSAELGNGLTGMFQVESGITSVGGTNGDGNGGTPNGSAFTNQRDTYVGVAGGFGTVLVGRLPGANQFVYDSNLFGDQIGDAATFTNVGMPGRANGALHYVAPAMGAVTVALTYLPATSVNSTVPSTTGGNSYGATAKFAASGITANVAYFNVKATTTTTLAPLSLAGSYDLGNGAMVTAQFVRGSVEVSGTKTTWNVFNVGGKFALSDDGAIKVQYSKSGATTGNADGASMIAVGYDYSLSKQTGLYVAYAMVSNDAAASAPVNNWGHGGVASTGPAAGEDPTGLSVGLTYNF